MNRIVKRLAVPLSAAAVLGTAGFAYMANNSVATSWAGAGTGTVDGYAVWNIHYGATDNGNGNIGYVKFDSIPRDNDHTVSSWPSSGFVTFPDGHTYSCTTSWGGTDTRTNGYTASFAGGSVTAGTPQASWVCDVRGAAPGNGEPQAGQSTLTVSIMA